MDKAGQCILRRLHPAQAGDAHIVAVKLPWRAGVGDVDAIPSCAKCGIVGHNAHGLFREAIIIVIIEAERVLERCHPTLLRLVTAKHGEIPVAREITMPLAFVLPVTVVMQMPQTQRMTVQRADEHHERPVAPGTAVQISLHHGIYQTVTGGILVVKSSVEKAVTIAVQSHDIVWPATSTISDNASVAYVAFVVPFVAHNHRIATIPVEGGLSAVS